MAVEVGTKRLEHHPLRWRNFPESGQLVLVERSGVGVGEQAGLLEHQARDIDQVVDGRLVAVAAQPVGSHRIALLGSLAEREQRLVASGRGSPAGDFEDRTAASRGAVKAFAQALKGELVAAIKAGGPVHAIEVCNHAAPDIAAERTAAAGWRIARTSLKPRNPGNRPDGWEEAVLEEFEATQGRRRGCGQPGGERDRHRRGPALVPLHEGDPDGGVCLACHGQSLAPEVSAALDALYPDDQARGFAVGDIRGAFTITQPVD